MIRNHSSDGYKWGKFEGIYSVKAKYSLVHEINRTGSSMFDNIIYFNIALEKDLFSRELLDKLLTTHYWDNLQQDLGQKQVPAIKLYPDTCILKHG